MKEHEDACKKMTRKSAIMERVWDTNHPFAWNETEVADQAKRRKKLLIKKPCIFSLHQRISTSTEMEVWSCQNVGWLLTRL